MFATSRDILNWILALSVLGLSFFVCWSLYYVVATLRSVYKVIAQIADTAEKISNLTTMLEQKLEDGARMMGDFGEKANDILNTLKDKLSNSGTHLMIIGEVLKRIFDFMQEKKEKMKSKKV